MAAITDPLEQLEKMKTARKKSDAYCKMRREITEKKNMSKPTEAGKTNLSHRLAPIRIINMGKLKNGRHH